MRIILERKGTYIPEWNGNRDLPKDEQIKVVFEYLTAIDKEELTSDEKGMNYATLAKNVWLSKVKEIENLEVDVDGKEIKATPENLLNLPDTWDLFIEAATHIFNSSSLNREQSKN